MNSRIENNRAKVTFLGLVRQRSLQQGDFLTYLKYTLQLNAYGLVILRDLAQGRISIRDAFKTALAAQRELGSFEPYLSPFQATKLGS